MSEPRTPRLTPAQQLLSDVWDEHLKHEFATKHTDHTLNTMVEHAYVNHVPVLTGGSGRDELHDFYSTYFIPQMPVDMTIVPVSRTIGIDRLVDESVAIFTHSIRMDWLLPGVAPTGKAVEVALVVVVEFQDGKLAGERIYWDQASVLVQLGLLDGSALPVAGVESARKVLDQTIPSNELIERANQGKHNA
jgi:carboxymethylenebutenolidase